MVSNEQYTKQFKFPYCDDVSSKYKKLAKIGHGTFGEVFKAQEFKSLREVAMKKIIRERGDMNFCITTLREIKLLKAMDHENIVKLIEVCRSEQTTWLIFEFCEHDLAGLIRNVNFSLEEIKFVLRQLFEGVFYIHNNNILHRDLKPSNILVNKQGILKIADFGLAKAVSKLGMKKPNSMTPEVVTLWYRPPEVILRDRNYGSAADLWSVGCIVAEMWTKSPIFKAETPQKLLILISKLCGSINSRSWPGVEKLELFNCIFLPQDTNKRVTARLMPAVKNRLGCDLLEKLLTLDPSKRINTHQALDHDFFWTDPSPKSIKPTLLKYNQCMLEYSSRSYQPPAKKPRVDDDSYVDRIY